MSAVAADTVVEEIELWELHSELVLVCPEVCRRALELLPERDPDAFLTQTPRVAHAAQIGALVLALALVPVGVAAKGRPWGRQLYPQCARRLHRQQLRLVPVGVVTLRSRLDGLPDRKE